MTKALGRVFDANILPVIAEQLIALSCTKFISVKLQYFILGKGCRTFRARRHFLIKAKKPNPKHQL